MIASLVMGIIALVLGCGLRYWINRRKFYRRSAFGFEGFSNYEKSVVVTYAERIGKWIAYALIVFGLLLIWSYYHWKNKMEKEAARKGKVSLYRAPYVGIDHPIVKYT